MEAWNFEIRLFMNRPLEATVVYHNLLTEVEENGSARGRPIGSFYLIYFSLYIHSIFLGCCLTITLNMWAQYTYVSPTYVIRAFHHTL